MVKRHLVAMLIRVQLSDFIFIYKVLTKKKKLNRHGLSAYGKFALFRRI